MVDTFLFVLVMMCVGRIRLRCVGRNQTGRNQDGVYFLVHLVDDTCTSWARLVIGLMSCVCVCVCLHFICIFIYILSTSRLHCGYLHWGCLHLIYILSTFHLHLIYILSTFYIHLIYILSTFYLHLIYIHLHLIYILSTFIYIYVHFIYT